MVQRHDSAFIGEHSYSVHARKADRLTGDSCLDTNPCASSLSANQWSKFQPGDRYRRAAGQARATGCRCQEFRRQRLDADQRSSGSGHDWTRSGPLKEASGLLEGNASQLLNQFVGVAMAWGIAIVGTLVILKVVDLTIGLRVSEEEEVQGLDLSQHGEEGYYWETPA